MSEEILAPLAGKVIKLNIQVGDKVEEDQEAFVIEAMKMETEVYVPCDGTVESVLIKQGDEVEEDDVLAIISDK
jgi:acetyl-CoA carboxylase biotin carboxyl carrier protein